MATHFDNDHRDAARQDFLKELELRAELMSDLAKNDLQDGNVLADWKHDGMRCQLLPDDRQGILRISIGGGDDLPVMADYCNIRGDIGKCIRLLERAVAALKKHP